MDINKVLRFIREHYEGEEIEAIDDAVSQINDHLDNLFGESVEQAQTIKELRDELAEYKAKELGFITTLYSMTEERKELQSKLEAKTGECEALQAQAEEHNQYIIELHRLATHLKALLHYPKTVFKEEFYDEMQAAEERYNRVMAETPAQSFSTARNEAIREGGVWR